MYKKEILFVICILIFTLQMAAVTTNKWSIKKYKFSDDDTNADADIELGLWKGCGDVWSTDNTQKVELDVCIDVPPDNAKKFPKNALYTCRVFSILGVATVFITLLCILFMENPHPYCHAIMLMFGGIFSLIASIVWATEMTSFNLALPNINSDFNMNLGPGFVLSLTSGILAILLSSVLFYYEKNQSEKMNMSSDSSF